MVLRNCYDEGYLTSILREELKSGCGSLQATLERELAACRTETRGVVPIYILVSLGDALARKLGAEEVETLIDCWCSVEEEWRPIIAVAMGRAAMADPDWALNKVEELVRCGWKPLTRWVLPIILLWNPEALEKIRRDIFLMAWSWYARYFPDRSREAIEKILSRAEVTDRFLVSALRSIRRVAPSEVEEVLRNLPHLREKVVGGR